jgi:hypothetical protein
MAFSASKYNYIAAFYAQIMFRDSNGYPMGTETDPDNVSADTTTSAYVINGLMDIVPAVPDYPVVTNFGSQQVIAQTRLPATTYGVPTMQFSQMDETFWGYIKSASVDVTTNTTRSMRGDNLGQTVFPAFMLSFAIQVTNSESGEQEWDNIAYLNADVVNTASPGAAQVTGSVTNPNPLQFALDLSLSTRDITGMLLSATNMALANDRDAVIRQRTANPLGYTTYVADGETTTFTLGFLPYSDDATGSAQNNITKNGTQTAVTSVSTETGLVTLAAAGDSGDIWVVSYETQKLGTN